MTGIEWWSAWPQARVDLEGRLAPATLAHLDAVAEFVRPYAGGPEHRRALHILQVLAAGGVTATDPLTAGMMLDLVRAAACSIQDVRYQFGGAVTMILVTLAPVVPDPGHVEAARIGALRRLSEASPGVQVVAFADAYVSAAWLGGRPDPRMADAIADEIRTYLLPIATAPFDSLLARVVAGFAPSSRAGGSRDHGSETSPAMFGGRLRRLRERAQLPPERVAAAAGMPAEFYVGLEAGRLDPGQLKVVQVHALAVALGANARDLLLDSEPGALG